MNPNRSLHKLLRVIFSEVLMEYFDISGWHDDSSKIEVWLDEKNYMERFDYKSGTVISSGFIDEKVIHVRRSIAQKLKGEDRETPPKNKSSVRDLQMPLPLINILNEHQKRYQSINGYSDNLRICGGIKCLRDTTIEKRNEKFAEIAKVKKIRIHDFRHSHASLLANNGINIQEIARRLGHTNIEITWNIYSHLYPQQEEKAVEILNKIV